MLFCLYLCFVCLFLFFITCCLMCCCRRRRRGWWFSDWAGEVDGSDNRRPYAACADIQDMDFGTDFVRCPCIHQPILCVQNNSSFHFFCVSTDYFSPTWQTHGQNTSHQSICFSIHQVVFLSEPWPLQFEGACTHHHLCRCWS